MPTTMTLTGHYYAGRLHVAKAVNWAARPLNELTLWAAQVRVQDRVLRAEFNHPASRLRLAGAVMVACKPLNRPTLWAAQVIINDRLRQQGMGDLASDRSSRFTPRPEGH